ncbi:MAG: hypothetical protein IJH87_04045 [Atopobiaceae bacterium]|nr:hypothetical protein [Atopobiaceae bacterium]
MARNTYPDDPIRDIVSILLDADAHEWLLTFAAAAGFYALMLLAAL